jgi:hypothetical protein
LPEDALIAFSSQSSSVGFHQLSNREAIRELVEAYAHCADRRDAKGQMSLFTPDTDFVVYMNAKDPAFSREPLSREALAPVFADLNQYAATMRFAGQGAMIHTKCDPSAQRDGLRFALDRVFGASGGGAG